MADTTKKYPPFFTGYIAGWVRRHRRLVLLGWLLIAVSLTATCFAVGANEDIEITLPGESGDAIELLKDRFDASEEGVQTETIVFSHPKLTVDDQEYRDTVQGLLRDLQALRRVETGIFGETQVASGLRVFKSTFSHYNIGAEREFSPFVSQNETGGDVSFARVEYAGNFGEVKARSTRSPTWWQRRRRSPALKS